MLCLWCLRRLCCCALVCWARTTHITGVVTDIGIELGKMLYWNRAQTPQLAQVQGDKPRLQLLSALLFSFLLGGVLGALGFKHLGYVATVPLALSLMGLVVVPVFDDVKAYFYR